MSHPAPPHPNPPHLIPIHPAHPASFYTPPTRTIQFSTPIQVGTNLSMIELAATLEEELGKPVVAINTATYWHAMRALGITDQFGGFGSLFRRF